MVGVRVTTQGVSRTALQQFGRNMVLAALLGAHAADSMVDITGVIIGLIQISLDFSVETKTMSTRNHSSRPAPAASLSTSKGTSCGPLVCLCYPRVAMHRRSFPSARVIVVVLPLPSVLKICPSVEPTTIVKTCIQFAGFEQN